MGESQKHEKLDIILRYFAALFCLTIITYFSSQTFHAQDLRPEIREHKTLVSEVRKLPEMRFTYSQKPTDNRKNPVDFIHFFIRKGAHMVLYGFLGLALALALRNTGLPDWRRWMVAAGILIVVAVLDEWHQTLVGDRTGMVKDVILDFGGFLIFASFAWIASKAAALLRRLLC